MYRITNSRQSRRRRNRLWLVFSFVFLAIAVGAGFMFVSSLKPAATITQSKAVTTKISYVGKTKHYVEDNFNIDIPSNWQLAARPPYTYNSFTWFNTDKSNTQEIEVYEDTIPTGFAVNKALIIKGVSDHIELIGQASDNCVTFTKDITSGDGNLGVKAKWLNVDFLCNRTTPTRDIIGTSSSDGINTVILKTTSGANHRFFFTYTDHQNSPDYTAFYNAMASFGMN
jgi:hypothetical protein